MKFKGADISAPGGQGGRNIGPRGPKKRYGPDCLRQKIVDFRDFEAENRPPQHPDLTNPHREIFRIIASG